MCFHDIHAKATPAGRIITGRKNNKRKIEGKKGEDCGKYVCPSPHPFPLSLPSPSFGSCFYAPANNLLSFQSLVKAIVRPEVHFMYEHRHQLVRITTLADAFTMCVVCVCGVLCVLYVCWLVVCVLVGCLCVGWLSVSWAVVCVLGGCLCLGWLSACWLVVCVLVGCLRGGLVRAPA
jgi:hypothetical protein